MQMPIVRRALAVLAMASAAGACSLLRQHEARDVGDLLVSAGFKVQLAGTPREAERIDAMKPLTLVVQPTDGSVVYRVADPYSCWCLYVGDEQAYEEYKRLARGRELGEEHLRAEGN